MIPKLAVTRRDFHIANLPRPRGGRCRAAVARRHSEISKALFPFGYMALIPVFALVSMRHATAGQVDALVSSLGFVLVASSVNDTAMRLVELSS